MSEWWTYTPSDFLLFSPRTYYRLFELTNQELWPLHLLMAALGLVILSVWWRNAWHGRLIAAILAAVWLFVAWAYLLTRYDTINWAATYFAAGFAIEALLLLWTGVVRNRLTLHPASEIAGAAGLCIVLFGLVIEPLIGLMLGRPWTQVEVFGIAPDPTVTVTLGVLVAAEQRNRHLLLIPLLWCAISGITLWVMESPDALVLPAVGVLALCLTLLRRTRVPTRNV